MDRRSGTSRTPSKQRAFGNKLSANTPLPLRQEQKQPPLSKSTQKQKPLTSVKKKKKKQNVRTSFLDDADARRCASERKLSTTTTTTERSDISSEASSLLLPPPLFTPASNDGVRSAGVHWGRNLMDNFNSPSTVNTANDIKDGGSGRVVSFSPRESNVGDTTWTKFTPKAPWQKGEGQSTHASSVTVPSSTAMSAIIDTVSPMHNEESSWTKFTPKIAWRKGGVAAQSSTAISAIIDSTVSPMHNPAEHTMIGDASWTKFTPKITWRKDSVADEGLTTNASSVSAQSSTATSAIIDTTVSPMHTPFEHKSTGSFPKLFAPSPLPMTRNFSPQPLPPITDNSVFPAQQLSTLAKSASPPSFAVQQLSVPTIDDMVSIADDVTIGPSEYAIRFPVEGESLLHLEFEPVTITSGRPTGCGIANILPGFEKSNACYILRRPQTDTEGNKETKEVAVASPSSKIPSLIQVNDLVVSINGISVLSRKYDFIMELLQQKFKNDDKIIVFRSIEKVWRSGSNGGNNQFSTRTMRNLRTGRRVATALNDDMMEDELHSWVKTPTQVAVGRRRRGGGIARIDSSAAGDNGGPATLFSPSNIKKMSLRGNNINSDYQSPKTMSSTLQPSSPSDVPLRSNLSPGGVVELAKTVKKSNARNIKNHHLDERGSSKKGEVSVTSFRTMERIGKVLTGEETRGDKGDEFKRSLRLKKELLNELKNVHSELEVLHSAKERMNGRLHETPDKVLNIVVHDDEDQIELSILQSQVDELKSERFDSLKAMIDMQAQLDDANAKVQEMENLVAVNTELLLSNKKLEESITVTQSDRDVARDELEKERLAISELETKLTNATENANIASKALEEEKLNSSHREASHAEQVRSLESRLAAEEQKASESSITHASIIAELGKRIATAESERDGCHLELERGRLALAASESERDEIANDLDKARSSIENLENEKMKTSSKLMDSEANIVKLQEEIELLRSDLNAERSTTIQLTSQLEQYDVNFKAIEMEKSKCMDMIDCITFEKDKLENKLRETAAVLELSINEKVEEAAALNDIIASSNDQVEYLKVQINSLLKENRELEKKVEEATAAVANVEEAAKAERMQFHERDASRIEHARCIEERLQSEENINVESAEAIGKLTTQLVAMQSVCESTRNELKKGRLDLLDMETANRAYVQQLQDQLSVAEKEYSRSRTECLDLRTDIDALKASESQLKDMTQSLSGRIGELEHELDSQRSINDKLLVEVKMLEDEVQQYDELQSELNSTSLILKRSQDELAEMKRDREVLEQRIDDLNLNLTLTEEKHTDDRDTYERSVLAFESEISGLKKSLATAECANADSQAMVQAHSVELTDKESSLAGLRAEIDRSKQASVAENESLNHLLEKRTAEIVAIQSVNESLTEQITHLSNELKENQSDAMKKHTDMSAQLSLLSTQLNEADNDMKRSDAQCTDHLTKLETAEELLDEGDSEIQRLNDECERLEEQVNELQHSLKNAEDSASELIDENESLRKLVESTTNEMKSESYGHAERERDFTHRYDALLKQLAESQNEAVKNEEIVAELTSKLKCSEESLTEAQHQMKSLIAQLAKASTSADDLRSEKDALLKQLIEFQNEAVHSKETVAELTSKLKCSEESLAEAQQETKTLNTQLASVTSDAAELQSDKDELQQQLVNSHNEFMQNKEMVAELTSKLKCSEESLAEAQQEMKTLIAQLAKASTSADDLRSEKDALQKELVESQNEAEHNKETVAELTSKLKCSEESLAEAQQEVKTLITQLASVTSAADELRSDKDELQQQLVNSHNEFMQNKEMVAELTSKLKCSEGSLAEAHQEMRTLITQLASVTSDAAELRSDKDELQQQLVKSHNEFMQNKEMVADLTSKLRCSEGSLAEAQHEMSSLHSRLASMSSHADELRSDKDTLVIQLESKLIEFESLVGMIRDLIDKVNSNEDCRSSSQFLHDTEINYKEELADDLGPRLECAEDRLVSKNSETQPVSIDRVRREMEVDGFSLLLEVEGTLSCLKDEKLSLESKLASVMSSRDQLQSEKESIIADLELKSNEVSRLNDVLTNIVHLGDSDKTELTSTITALEIDLVRVNSDLESKRAENSSLVNQLRESKAIFDDLTTEIRRAESQYQRQVECYENRIKELLLQNDDVAMTIQNLSDRCEQLEAQSIRERLSHELTTKQASSELQNLHNVLSGSEIKKVHLMNELDALKAVLKTKDSDFLKVAGEKDSQLESMAATIKTMENEICRLEHCVASAEETISSLTTERIRTEDEMESKLNDAKESFETTNDRLKERVQQLQGELDLCQQSLSQTKECIRENEVNLLSQLSAAKQRENDLCEQVEEMEHLLNSVESTKETMNDHIQRLQDDLSVCQQMLTQTTERNRDKEANLFSELSAMKQREQDLCKQVEDLEHLLNSVESAKEAMSGHIQRLQDDINVCQQTLSQTKECSRENEAKLLSELSTVKQSEQDLRIQVEEMEHLLNASEATNCTMHDHIQRLQVDLKVCQDNEINLASELSTVKQSEQDLREQVTEKEHLLNSSQKNIDAHVNENNELHQLTLKLSADLQACKDEIKDLRQMLQEGIELNSSLSESSKMNERVMREQSMKIEQLKSELHSTVQSGITRESESARELVHLAEEINFMQASMELHIAERDAFAKKVEVYNQTQSASQSKLHAIRQELAQLSKNIPNDIASAKSTFEALINRVVIKFNAEKSDLRREIEVLRSEKLQQQIQIHNELLTKDEESRVLASTYTSKLEALRDEMNATKRDLAVLTSKNAELETVIQQQEDSLSKINVASESEIGRLQGEFYVATGKLELATIKLDHEKSTFERKIESLQALLQEKCLLNRSLVARLEVASLSAQRTIKLDTIAHAEVDTIAEYRHESEVNELMKTLESRDDSIKQLSIDLSNAQEENVALQAAKEIWERKILTLREEYERRLLNESEDKDKLLQQANDQNVKLGSRYERIVAEIESCREHAIDLKAIIIEKNKEIELKEGAIMELQYKVDYLEAQADGWRLSSLERPEHDYDQRKFSSEDVSEMFAASTKRHESLSTEFVKLEEQCLRMEEDFRQRSSMQEAIVDGLESECKKLFGEIAEFQIDLQEKLNHIASLEEAKEQLEIDVEMLKKDKDDACYKLTELHKLCNGLRQEKAAAETLTNSVTSAARKLACVALEHGSKLDGFPTDTISLSSWSESIHAIAQFIDYASKVDQGQHETVWRTQACISDATTPKTKGRCNPAAVDLMTQHSNMLDDLKSMKNAIANAMASPRLTPLKSSGGEKSDCDEEMYTDLLRAQEQMESLSLKIQSFQDDQSKWKEWEAYYEDRIAELEGENQIMKAAALPDDSQEVKMKEISAILIYIFQHRYRRSVMQRAFQTWVSHTRMSKQVGIVKNMAQELTMTRRKVLLLKSHLEENS